MKNVLENDTNNTQKKWVVEMMEHKDITPASKLVGTTIYLMWWNEDSEIFPSNKSIMRATGLSDKSITRGVKELVNEGFITITGNKSTQGESYHYHPQSGKQAVKDAADAIAADYLNCLSTTDNLSTTTDNLSPHYRQSVPTYGQDVGVSNKEIGNRNSNEVIEGEEEVKECGVSLDSEASVARVEHSVMDVFDKEKARQQRINDEVNAEFPNPYVEPKRKTLAEQHKEKQAIINSQFAEAGK